MKKEIIKYALIDAFGTALYVVAIASFLFNIPKFFGGGPDTIFAPIVMLMLLVFSVALTGSLIFGRPMMWYLRGERKEAVLLLVYTLATLMLLTFCALLTLLLSQ